MNYPRILVFSLFFVFYSIHVTKAQDYAPDIVVTDCNGNEHNLYEKLSSGKIIVIGWTMPCATCAAPLLDAHNVVLQYAISNPEVVEYWLADDYAETTCETVKDWSETNGITNAVFFSTEGLDMLDFGSTGMPKVVVVGCNQAFLYYNHNDFINGTDIDKAIETALNDINNSCKSVSVNEKFAKVEVKAFPNPTTNTVNIVISHDFIAEVQIINALGQVIISKIYSDAKAFKNVEIDLSTIEKGLYYAKVSNGNSTVTIPIQKS